MMRYRYRIRSGGKIYGLAHMKSSDRLTLSARFGEKMSVAPQVLGEDRQSYIHSLLQSNGESTDLEGLFSFLGWL